ncbi:MAG: hypothetical protein M5R36_16065 [Deltaproteobacteria bacterium]|nr:hypothetical protein [Deltaproteobacteria bacterium]
MDSAWPPFDIAVPVHELDARMTMTQREARDDVGDFSVRIALPVLTFEGAQAREAADGAWRMLHRMRIGETEMFLRESATSFAANATLRDYWKRNPPLAGPLFLLPLITGTHGEGVNGTILFHGPGVRAATTIDGARVEDVAPTIYAYLGVPPAKDLDGEALAAAFQKDALPGLKKKAPKTFLPPPGPASADARRKLTQERINHLRSLGYFQ